MLRQSGSATLPAPASPAPFLQQRLSSGLQIPFTVQNPQARLSLPTCLSGGRGAQEAFWEGKSRRKGGMDSNANPQGEQRGRDRDQHWQSQVTTAGTGRTAPANAALPASGTLSAALPRGSVLAVPLPASLPSKTKEIWGEMIWKAYYNLREKRKCSL